MFRLSTPGSGAWSRLTPTYEGSGLRKARTFNTSTILSRTGKGDSRVVDMFISPRSKAQKTQKPKDIPTKGKHFDIQRSSSPTMRQRFTPSYVSPRSSSFVGHASARPSGSPLSPKKSKHMTPSEKFMEERDRALNFARSLSERAAQKAQREKALLVLAMKANEKTPKPVYTFQSPKLVPGDVSGLFSPESTQNRTVLPGDFVEIRKAGKAVYGIYLQNFDQAEGRLQSTSVTQGDTILAHRTADVTFRIPGYAFMEKNRAFVGHWDVEANPDSPPPGMGKIAATFADDAKVILGTFYTKFNTLYDTFWHKRQKTMLTTPEAARFIFGKEGQEAAPLTLQEMYATHLYLTQDESLQKFVPAVSVRWTGEFALQPPQEVRLMETVISWVRKGDPRVAQFQEKARILIDSFREGEKTKWRDITFTDSDRTLIEFVRQTAFTGYSDVFISPLLAYLPRLLRPLDKYGDIDPSTAFMFLKEIGIWPSWYNMEINRSAIALSDSLGEERAIMDKILKLCPESLQQDFDAEVQQLRQEQATSINATERGRETGVMRTSANPLVLKDHSELYRRDPCDAIRHDFGNQPIYAIDDPSASELDDAFSVEPVPTTTLTPKPSTWVHVHVADPTSILPPFHEMSRLAASRAQTAYLPEGSWPMLPRELTENSLSLKNDGRPKKVMTFSARICNDNAEILEYKIRPGLVRNVVTLNYDDVDEFLSWERVNGGKAEGMRVRNSVMRMPEHKTFDREYYRATKGSVNPDDKSLIKVLQDLQVIAQSHQDFRMRSGAFVFNLGRPLIELTPYPLQPVAEAGWEAPIDFSQWQEPEISCRLDPGFASPSRIMVAEYMVLAGRVAALFAQERGLPMLYRNQSPPAEKHRTMFDEKIREKTNPQTGMMSLVDMMPLRPYIPGAEISTTPIGHWSLGIMSGYCKVTSPLRRYSDMVSHWQLKGLLLSKTTASSPPFGLDELVPLAGMIRERERMLGMMEARSVKFWLYEMLRRRLELGLSNIFEGFVMNPTADGYNVMSTLLGFQTVVKAEADEIIGVNIGTKVMFEVNSSNPQRPYIGAKHIQVL
ncbi:hypothetical protein BGX26_012658 [Mortierella sp. AD094]|nr:hypothetical protein BGX26_012658 [Mortierella sp. AD094]